MRKGKKNEMSGSSSSRSRKNRRNPKATSSRTRRAPSSAKCAGSKKGSLKVRKAGRIAPRSPEEPDLQKGLHKKCSMNHEFLRPGYQCGVCSWQKPFAPKEWTSLPPSEMAKKLDPKHMLHTLCMAYRYVLTGITGMVRLTPQEQYELGQRLAAYWDERHRLR